MNNLSNVVCSSINLAVSQQGIWEESEHKQFPMFCNLVCKSCDSTVHQRKMKFLIETSAVFTKQY